MSSESHAVTAATHSVDLRVATWNVLHGMDLRRGGQNGLAEVAEAIAALSADIVALQEVDRDQPRSGSTDQIAWLADRLGWSGVFGAALFGSPDTSWTAVTGPDSGGAAYGVGLLSRLPVRSVRTLRLPGGGDGARRATTSPSRPGWDREPRVAVSAELVLGGRSVWCTTTHLSYLPWRGLRQLRVVAGAAEHDGAPAILLGDLNLPPNVVRPVTRRWSHAGGDLTYPASDPRMQVDHILVRGLDVRSARVGDAAGSDHRPVVADVTLP